MFSNEQRAHDLAIAMLESVKQGRISEAVENTPNEVTNITVGFDYYREYKSLYEEILKLIERDFN